MKSHTHVRNETQISKENDGHIQVYFFFFVSQTIQQTKPNEKK